jgi:hypothetical protein
MTIFEDGVTLREIGALVTAGLGVMGLVRPHAAASFTSLRPAGTVGVSEIRATYGGLFLALGAFALLSGSSVVYRTLGIAWAGAAAGRIVSVVADGSRSGKNLGGILFEGALALFLLYG